MNSLFNTFVTVTSEYWNDTFTQRRFDVRIASIHTFSSVFITRFSIFTISTCDVTSSSVKSILTFYTQKEQIIDKKEIPFESYKDANENAELNWINRDLFMLNVNEISLVFLEKNIFYSSMYFYSVNALLS